MSSSLLKASRIGWSQPVNEASKSPGHSYGQILTSSLLIGGSSLVTLLTALARNKVLSVFLGPAGVGLMGLFSSMTSVVGTATGMGITTSGVRAIAEAVGAGNEPQVARSVTAVWRVVVWLGLLGALFLALFSVLLSRLTFGTADRSGQIVLLSVVIAAGAVTDGLTSRLQGLRRIGDLARVSVLGAALTLTLSLPIVLVWRQEAVVPLLLLASVAGATSSWWYARRIPIRSTAMGWRETLREARPLLHLGLASMSSAVMVTGIAYLVRVVVARQLGLGAAGIVQSATALSSVYCGFILSAMGADFLPRLSAVADDDTTSNRLVNEQAEVGLLLAFPGVCATLAFAPLILQLLYSAEFSAATDVLRWQVLGVFLRVASWPMGYLLIAKGRARLYFWTELSYNVAYAALIWICVRLWGLAGAGVAFFGLYIYYCVLMRIVTQRLSGFVWSAANRRLAAIAIPTIAFVLACPLLLPAPWDTIAAAAATLAAGLYSLRTLLSLPGNQGIRAAVVSRIPCFARQA